MRMKTLHIRPLYGLANRLMALLAAMRVAELTASRLRVIWEPDAHCNTALRNLFPGAFDECAMDDVPEDAIVLSSKSLGGVQFINMIAFENDQDILIEDHHFFYLASDAWHMSHRKGVVARQFEHIFARLPITREVTDIVSSYNDRGMASLGLHIRRPFFKDGHCEDATQLKWLFPNDIDYINFSKSVCANYNLPDLVFLSTNSIETRRCFSDHFGDKVFFHNSVSTEQDTPDAARDALVDILCLSRSAYICRREPSTFGFLAAVIGNKPCITLYLKEKTMEQGNMAIGIRVNEPLMY